jgi:hypothetical protein
MILEYLHGLFISFVDQDIWGAYGNIGRHLE